MTNPDPEAVTALVRLYRSYADQIAQLQAQQMALRARFAALVPVGCAVDVDGKVAQHAPPNRAFSEDAAVKLAHDHGIPVAVREVVDTTELRARLRAAGLVDQAMLPGTGEPRVVLG